MNELKCPLCNAPIEPERTHCSRCEQLLSGVSPAQPQSSAGKPKWYYNVWVVLLMLLFVLGPFGLPLVWKNPTFSRGVKVALTVVMVVYTMLLIDATLKAVTAVLNHLQQFNAAF